MSPRLVRSNKRRIWDISVLLAAFFVANAALVRAEDRPSDELLELAVENELLSDEAIDCHGMDVTVSEGVVTLSGRINSLRGRQRATEATKLLRGVRSVINQMVLLPPQRKDDLLTLDVEHALTQNSATESYQIIAAVKDGIAHLGGTVDSHAERRLAEFVTAGVAGIVEVDNRIDVEPKQHRPDKELAADIRELIAASPMLEDTTVDVVVSEGTAVLNGVVGTLAERDTAEELASVSGIRSVDVRGLKIDPSIRDGVQRRSRYAELSDETIADAVRLTLKHDPRVLSFTETIDVESKDAVVTLRGDVGHATAKRAAELAARNTLGVDRVRNRLNIAWSEDVNDDEIEDFVRAALLRDSYVGGRDILVRSRRAHVDLFGLVDSKFEKYAAHQTAEMQRGVVHVNNNLTVVNAWEPRGDSEIQEAIDEKLKWSFFDKASDIEVRVDNGVALLQGTVDTWRQWQHVMDIAVKAGARRPHNQLKIRFQPKRGRNPLYVPMDFGGAPTGEGVSPGQKDE